MQLLQDGMSLTEIDDMDIHEYLKYVELINKKENPEQDVESIYDMF